MLKREGYAPKCMHNMYVLLVVCFFEQLAGLGKSTYDTKKHTKGSIRKNGMSEPRYFVRFE